MTRLYQEGFKGTIWNTFAAKKLTGPQRHLLITPKLD